MAGCTTQPSEPPPGEIISVTRRGDFLAAELDKSRRKTLIPAAAQRLVERPAQINKPPVIVPKPAPAPPVTTWTSLNRWAAAHHIGAPHRLSDMPVTAYAVGSSNGVMVLEIGSHEATWNGVQINLGFAPEMIDGEVCLHGLDLQKNLEPLLCGPPLAFGANRIIVIDPGHGGSNHGTAPACRTDHLKRSLRSTGRCGSSRCWKRTAGRYS